jgi:succinate dehydrogenase hydrophobic anchor subunit
MIPWKMPRPIPRISVVRRIKFRSFDCIAITDVLSVSVQWMHIFIFIRSVTCTYAYFKALLFVLTVCLHMSFGMNPVVADVLEETLTSSSPM